MALKILDLFCGCGGLSLGFEMAGCEVKLGVDNDDTSLKTFLANHKNSIALNTDLGNGFTEDIESKLNTDIDIVIGGPPCQGFSLSGPRKLDDPRNTLISSFIDVVEKVAPKVFIMENVPGIISLYKGAVKDYILDSFKNIGFKVTYKTVLAADYGVPQTRKRIIFVGMRNAKMNFEFPKPIYFKTDSLFEPKHLTASQALSDLPPLEDENWSDKMSYVSEPKNNYQEWCRNSSKIVHNHIGTNHSDKVKKIISLVPEGGNYKDLPEKYRETRKFNVAWTRYHSQKPASTIDTGHRHHFHYKYNRVLTVRENARLQSFPDDFIFFGNKSQQNRQVGNAVPPLLGKAIAMKLLNSL